MIIIIIICFFVLDVVDVFVVIVDFYLLIFVKSSLIVEIL